MSNDHIIGRDVNNRDQKKIKSGLKLADGGKVSQTTYHHEESMDQMIKAIEFTPMDRRIKAVLKLRLMGWSFENMQDHLLKVKVIAGSSIESLQLDEAEGKRLVMETLTKYTMEHIINTINAKPRVIAGLRNEMTNPDFGLS